MLYENGTRAPAGEDINLARGSALLWKVTHANGILATQVTLLAANAAPLVWITAAVGISGGLAAGAAGAWTVAKRRSGKS